MKILGLFAVTFVTCNVISLAPAILQEWSTFKTVYKRTYSSSKLELRRKKIFLSNKYYVERHNELFRQGEVLFECALNKFSDWTIREVHGILNGYNKLNRLLGKGWVLEDGIPNDMGENYVPPNLLRVPPYVDWVEMGAVTPVKSQGICGSCYAFSSIGALEGQLYLKNKTLLKLSVQNVLDCSIPFGNQGCGGGLPTNTYNYIQFSGGVNTEKIYPYKGRTHPCRFLQPLAEGNVLTYYKIQGGNETALKLAVASAGPIAIAVDANSRNFQFYKRGIYHDALCSSSQLNHAVLLVGYGTDHKTKKDYWIIKNSWGKNWGEHGYMKLERNAGNMCGVATLGHFPSVDDQLL